MNSLLIEQTGRNIPSGGESQSPIMNLLLTKYRPQLTTNSQRAASFYLPQKYMHTPQCPLNVPVECTCSIKQSSTIDAGAFANINTRPPYF